MPGCRMASLIAIEIEWRKTIRKEKMNKEKYEIYFALDWYDFFFACFAISWMIICWYLGAGYWYTLIILYTLLLIKTIYSDEMFFFSVVLLILPLVITWVAAIKWYSQFHAICTTRFYRDESISWTLLPLVT